jgi:hypothetical protein
MQETSATVSPMETGPVESPSPQEARAALRQVAADENAVRYPPIPRWFFVVMAAVVAALYLAQLLPPADASRATFAVAVVAVVVGSRYWFNRQGVSWVSPRLADMLPFLTAVLGTFALCWAVDATTGAWWCWIAGAVVGGAVVLVTGHRYVREFGDGR